MENKIYLKTFVCRLANATVRCTEGQKFVLAKTNQELVYGGGSRLGGIGIIEKGELCYLIGRVDYSNDIFINHNGSDLRFSSLFFDYYDSDQLTEVPNKELLEPKPKFSEDVLLLVEEKIDRLKREILDLLKGS